MPSREEKVFQYDVALSFAGEDRHHAERLARLLEARGLQIFYDSHERANLWGKDLYEHLSDVYAHRAKFCVMFLSGHYSRKSWTTHERKNAQARAFKERKEYILPLRLDDTDIPGIPGTIGYVDLRNTGMEEVADLVVEKVGRTAPRPADSRASGSRPTVTVAIPMPRTKRNRAWVGLAIKAAGVIIAALILSWTTLRTVPNSSPDRPVTEPAPRDSAAPSEGVQNPVSTGVESHERAPGASASGTVLPMADRPASSRRNAPSDADDAALPSETFVVRCHAPDRQSDVRFRFWSGSFEFSAVPDNHGYIELPVPLAMRDKSIQYEAEGAARPRSFIARPTGQEWIDL